MSRQRIRELEDQAHIIEEAAYQRLIALRNIGQLTDADKAAYDDEITRATNLRVQANEILREDGRTGTWW